MGSSASVVKKKRYIGGKLMPKFFNEEVWPVYISLFDKLNLDEYGAYAIFIIFANMDVENRGELSQEECYQYIGGKRTAFTDRIFFIDKKVTVKGEVARMKFDEWLIMLWSFCTLTVGGMARLAFEVFDPDNRLIIERPDVEAMFRMLYATVEFDDRYVSCYQFNDYGEIDKSDFVEESCRKKAFMLMNPIINYQDRVRKCVGGIKLWKLLTKYRMTQFGNFDSSADSLNLSVKAIVTYVDIAKERKRQDNERKLEDNRLRLEAEKEQLLLEQKRREAQLEAEKEEAERNAEDGKMKVALKRYKRFKEQQQKVEFTVETVWDKHEVKEQLYIFLDDYINEHNIYWEWKDKQTMQLAEGTDGDKEYRYKDYLRNEHGKLFYQLLELTYLFEEALSNVYKELTRKAKKKSINKNKKDSSVLQAIQDDKNRKKTNKEMYTEQMSLSLRTYLDRFMIPSQDKYEEKQKWRRLKEKKFDEERKYAKKYTSKKEFEVSHKYYFVQFLKDFNLMVINW